MKKIIAILLISVSVLILVIFLGLHIFLNLEGKNILVKQIQKNLGRKASVQSMSVGFPLSLDIKKLDIDGLLKVDDIHISTSLIGFMLGKIVFNELKIIKPTIYLERTPEGNLDAPLLPKKETIAETKAKIFPRTKIFSTIRSLKLIDGEIVYLDKKIKPEGLTIKIEDLDMDIQNVLAIPSLITRFKLKGAIPWAANGHRQGSISFTGWTDLYKRDGKAELKIDNIDAIYLYPYYDTYVSLEETNIQKATLHFLSNMSASDNNLTAECHLELGQLVFKEEPQVQEKPRFDKDKVTQILDIFKSSEDKITLDFVIRTRLSKPLFGIDNIRMAVDEKFAQQKSAVKAEDILKVPGKVMAGAVEGTAEVSRAFISGAKSLGLEIKRALEAAFRREPKEENQ